jgi:hypothetical protein
LRQAALRIGTTPKHGPQEQINCKTAFSPQLTQLTSRGNDTSATMALAGEEKLFESRKTSRTGQRAQLRERIAQLNEEIRGVTAQLEAKQGELDLIGKELVGRRRTLSKESRIDFALHPTPAAKTEAQ